MGKAFVMAMEVVSPIGVSLEKHMDGIRSGRSGSAPIIRFDASGFRTNFACEVREDLSPLLAGLPASIKTVLPFDRKLELFCAALEMLYPKTAAKMAAVSPERTGVFIGAGMETNSQDPIIRFSHLSDRQLLEEMFRQNRMFPYVNTYFNPSHLATLQCAVRFSSRGIRQTNISACAASTQSLGAAALAVAQGTCDAAIVGGCDSTINPFILTAFLQLDMLSTRNDSPQTASRPFDRGRDGFVPGEGAGVVILTNERVAQKWGDPLAVVAGYGSSLDGYKITAPHPQGLGAVLAMRRALASAGWPPESVDYVNAHGTSTPLNDAVESNALRQVFGDALSRIAVSSTKSQIGHLIAAGGIVEFISVVAAMREGILPPSINVERQDRACPLNLVREPGVRRPIRRAISNSFALAGQNATVAIEAI
jgi:3-oxoacyl-[acyl-carrier-protein] synthase II